MRMKLLTEFLSRTEASRNKFPEFCSGLPENRASGRYRKIIPFKKKIIQGSRENEILIILKKIRISILEK